MCSRHRYQVRPSCQECWTVAEENRKRKLARIEERMAQRKSQEERRLEREAARAENRKRRAREKFNTKGNCVWHHIPPVVKSGRRYCSVCYSASHRRAKRKREEVIRQTIHDANVKTAVHGFGRRDILDVFIADIFKKAA
jgi:hypothetical protein